jgi:TRAP-type C4-dicarboxylate transport system substrate-binding protein
MKEYIIPIAIIIGAIIISATTYYALTDSDRKAYEHCVQMVEKGKWRYNADDCKSYVYKK